MTWDLAARDVLVSCQSVSCRRIESPTSERHKWQMAADCFEPISGSSCIGGSSWSTWVKRQFLFSSFAALQHVARRR